MSEATEKQTAILLKNGFNQSDIDKMNKKAISDEIGKIFGNNKKPVSSGNGSSGVVGATEGISKVEHVFQSSYEFGPAGNRFNIRYWNVEDLKKQMAALEEAGLFVVTEKI